MWNLINSRLGTSSWIHLLYFTNNSNVLSNVGLVSSFNDTIRVVCWGGISRTCLAWYSQAKQWDHWLGGGGKELRVLCKPCVQLLRPRRGWWRHDCCKILTYCILTYKFFLLLEKWSSKAFVKRSSMEDEGEGLCIGLWVILRWWCLQSPHIALTMGSCVLCNSHRQCKSVVFFLSNIKNHDMSSPYKHFY